MKSKENDDILKLNNNKKELEKFLVKYEGYKNLWITHYDNQKLKTNKLCEDIITNLKVIKENLLKSIDEEYQKNMNLITEIVENFNKLKWKFNYFEEFDDNNKTKTLNKFNNLLKNNENIDWELISINSKAKNNKINENLDIIKDLFIINYLPLIKNKKIKPPPKNNNPKARASLLVSNDNFLKNSNKLGNKLKILENYHDKFYKTKTNKKTNWDKNNSQTKVKKNLIKD